VFQEFYVEDATAIEELIKLVSVNPKFDYKKFMTPAATEA
jgi:hypothetical protein